MKVKLTCILGLIFSYSAAFAEEGKPLSNNLESKAASPSSIEKSNNPYSRFNNHFNLSLLMKKYTNGVMDQDDYADFFHGKNQLGIFLAYEYAKANNFYFDSSLEFGSSKRETSQKDTIDSNLKTQKHSFDSQLTSSSLRFKFGYQHLLTSSTKTSLTPFLVLAYSSAELEAKMLGYSNTYTVEHKEYSAGLGIMLRSELSDMFTASFSPSLSKSLSNKSKIKDLDKESYTKSYTSSPALRLEGSLVASLFEDKQHALALGIFTENKTEKSKSEKTTIQKKIKDSGLSLGYLGSF